MDREKVIEELHSARRYLEDKEWSDRGASPHIDAINNALTMLKEQEAVKPKSKVRHGANAQIQYFCGNCNSMLHGKPKYCSECGKGVLW